MREKGHVVVVGEHRIGYSTLIPADSVPDKAIVLIHGALGTKETLDFLADSLFSQSKEYQILQLDLPSHGDSVGSPVTNVEGVAEIMRKAIELLHASAILPADITVIGHSYGGSVAVTAVLQGLVVDKLIACMSASTWTQFYESVRDIPAEQLPHVFAQLMAGETALMEDQQEAQRINALVPSMTASGEAGKADIEGLGTFNIRTKLVGLSIPFLAISAEKDTTAPPSLVSELARAFPNGEHVTIENGTHISVITDAEKVSQEIINFL